MALYLRAENPTWLRSSSLSCRLSDKESCGGKFDLFLERCFYQPGQYASEEDFSALSERLSEVEKVRAAFTVCQQAACVPSCPGYHGGLLTSAL